MANALVFNQTKVIPAELNGERIRGPHRSAVSITLHQRVGDNRWQAFARPAKRLKPDDRVIFGTAGTACAASALEGTVVDRLEGGLVEIDFDLAGAALDQSIAEHGHMPLPPYIASRRPKITATGWIIRPSMPENPALSPRQLPACISPKTC